MKRKSTAKKTSRRSTKRAARKPAARRGKKVGAPTAKKPTRRKDLPKPVPGAPMAAGSHTFGESQGKTRDSEGLARQAALDLEIEGEEEMEGTPPRAAEEEPEW